MIEDKSETLLKPYPSYMGPPMHVIVDRAMIVQWISPPDLDYWYDEAVILPLIKRYL